MTSKEFAIKTAEILRYEVKKGNIGWGWVFPCLYKDDKVVMYLSDWHPEENLKKAFEILNSICDGVTNYYTIVKYLEAIKVVISSAGNNHWTHFIACEKELPKSICEAVKKWMEATIIQK